MWLGEEMIDFDKHYGFVYMITNLTNGKKYVGRKILFNTTKKRIGKREKTKTKTRKTFKYVVKESNWRDYTGSSIELNADIEKGDILEKKILKMCETKKQMSYFEEKYQFQYNVLEIDSYNLNIGGKFFRKDL